MRWSVTPIKNQKQKEFCSWSLYVRTPLQYWPEWLHRPYVHLLWPGHWKQSSHPTQPGGWPSRQEGVGRALSQQPADKKTKRLVQQRLISNRLVRGHERRALILNNSHWVLKKCVYLPSQSMKSNHSSIVGAKRSHWVRQNLLEGQQDLMVEATHQIPMSP